jgi:hypothetical protein
MQNHPVFWFLAMLRMDTKTSRMLGMCSITEQNPQPQSFIFECNFLLAPESSLKKIKQKRQRIVLKQYQQG